MSLQEVHEITIKITEFIEEHGGDYQDWYVGITNNPERRLDEHNVDMDDAESYIVLETSSAQIARRVEWYFATTTAVQGGTGGGESDSRYVYAGRIREE